MRRFLSQTLSIIHRLSLQMSDEPKKAALYITAMNAAEIYVQLKSKFIQGAIGGLTGGANPFALALSVGFYTGALNFGGFDFSETDKSNQKSDSIGN